MCEDVGLARIFLSRSRSVGFSGMLGGSNSPHSYFIASARCPGPTSEEGGRPREKPAVTTVNLARIIADLSQAIRHLQAFYQKPCKQKSKDGPLAWLGGSDAWAFAQGSGRGWELKKLLTGDTVPKGGRPVKASRLPCLLMEVWYILGLLC